MENKKVAHGDIMKMLDACYAKALDGIPLVSPSVADMANDYLEKYSKKEAAIKAMLKNQVIKCTTSGFVTGFGGFITMPVTIPANIGSVIYVQMRMIACSAYMMDYDLKSDQTQTFVYACLAGIALNTTLKQVGIKFGVKMAQGLVNKIPGKVLIKTHIMRLLISLWDVGTVFFTIYPQVFRHEKSSIYYKYIEPLSYCFSISFKILIITVYGFMKWYICKCLFCKVYLLDLSYNRNAKPMTGSNELRFNLTQIRG